VANVNVRKPFSKEELWRAVGMVYQGAPNRQVSEVFGYHLSLCDVLTAWHTF
jgi:hypothetical protein